MKTDLALIIAALVGAAGVAAVNGTGCSTDTVSGNASCAVGCNMTTTHCMTSLHRRRVHVAELHHDELHDDELHHVLVHHRRLHVDGLHDDLDAPGAARRRAAPPPRLHHVELRRWSRRRKRRRDRRQRRRPALVASQSAARPRVGLRGRASRKARRARGARAAHDELKASAQADRAGVRRAWSRSRADFRSPA